MLRIRAITPIHVGAAEVRRRQQRYERLAPAGLEIHLDDIGDGAPRALETEGDVRRSESLVIEEIRRTDADRYDAVLPDCVLDPGVGVLADAPVPVVGLLALCGHFLAGAGQRFAAVTRNAAIGAELRRKAGTYGMSEALTDVRVLGLSVADIPDDAAWARAITRSVADLPVGAVFNGCSAVDVRPAGAGPRIVDPTAVALRVLGLAAELDVVGGPAALVAR